MAAHTAIVFTRYMMLSLEARESTDERSLGELFLYFSDEQADITWVQAFHLLLKMFRELLAEYVVVPDEIINEFLDMFFAKLPAPLVLALR